MKKEKNYELNNGYRIWFWILIAGTIGAALKCIFVSLQMDEEYAISLSYRLLRGDKLISEIWDPHQTSAFLMQILMWIFVTVFHTTRGIVIWVRVWGTAIHALVAWRVYRYLETKIEQPYSILLAVLYFNMLPKGYVMPEFSNMVVWSVTLLFISLDRADRNYIMTGIWLSLAVLSYPSAALLYFFVVYYIWNFEEEGKRGKGIALVTGVAALLAAFYMAGLLHDMSLEELRQNIAYMMASNGAHSMGLAYQGKVYALNILELCGWILLYSLLAAVFCKVWKREWNTRWKYATCLILAGITWQTIHWLVMLWKYEYSFIYTEYFIVLGLAFWISRKEKSAEKTLWIYGSLVLLLCVLLLTNLTIFTSVKYLMGGVIGAAVILLKELEKKDREVYQRAGLGILMFACISITFIKGWAYPDSDGLMRNITSVGTLVSEGPGTGLVMDYIQGYMEEENYRELREMVAPGDALMILDQSTMSYLYQDVTIASPTTICTPTYDETLLEYWKDHPDRKPNVVAVSCWYGELKWDPDSFIMKYLEDEFDADQIIDGSYYRYYIKQ